MNLDFYLPTPTEDELNYGAKVDYYRRLIKMELQNKYKIPLEELYAWIHYNYSSIFVHEIELSYKNYKKIKL